MKTKIDRGEDITDLKFAEAIVRAILFPGSNIIIAGKDKKESNEHYNKLKSLIEQHSDVLSPEIKKYENVEIEFKNGSYIKAAYPSVTEDNIRGKRAKLYPWIYGYESPCISNEGLEEVLKIEKIMDK